MDPEAGEEAMYPWVAMPGDDPLLLPGGPLALPGYPDGIWPDRACSASLLVRSLATRDEAMLVASRAPPDLVEVGWDTIDPVKGTDPSDEIKEPPPIGGSELDQDGTVPTCIISTRW